MLQNFSTYFMYTCHEISQFCVVDDKLFEIKYCRIELSSSYRILSVVKEDFEID